MVTIMTETDWFDIEGASGQLYELGVFGVTDHSKHAMVLRTEKEDIEIFHLDELNSIIRVYGLKWVEYNKIRAPMTRKFILDYSKQLHKEGLGVISDWAEKRMLIEQEEARQSKTQKDL